MRKERLTYKELTRRLLAGRLLRGDERRDAREILELESASEVARRLGGLLETVAGRDGLLRLGSEPDDPPQVRRYLDVATNDHWAVELPGPRAVPAPPGPAPEGTRAADERAAADPAAAPAPPPPPAEVGPVVEVTLEPGVAGRFLDRSTGEPLRTLFSAFSPCKTPEDLGASLGPVHEQIVARTSATDVRFHMLADEGEVLAPIPLWGGPATEVLPLGGRVEGEVVGAKKTLHIPDLAAAGADRAGALVTIPLVSGERLTGVMEVLRERPGAFDDEELRFFSLTALIAGGMMARAEVLEKLIFLDKLTGLYNRAYFDDAIEREIERANRQGTSVALVMIDVDHFKKINDTHGHLVGDRTLAHLASIVHGNIRQIDVAARFGGEEFAILLPTTTRARADLTADRLRRTVYDTRFGDAIPELGDTRVSFSAGIALYPDDAATAKQLIDRADRVALYTAKSRGRNRVVSWATARETNERLRPNPEA